MSYHSNCFIAASTLTPIMLVFLHGWYWCVMIIMHCFHCFHLHVTEYKSWCWETPWSLASTWTREIWSCSVIRYTYVGSCYFTFGWAIQEHDAIALIQIYTGTLWIRRSNIRTNVAAVRMKGCRVLYSFKCKSNE